MSWAPQLRITIFFSGYFLGSANFFVDKYLDFIHFFLIWEGVPGVGVNFRGDWIVAVSLLLLLTVSD